MDMIYCAVDKICEEKKNEGEVFEEGYSPDKCWFRNGYITKEMIGIVREALLGSDEMSDEDIILVCDFMGFNSDEKELTVESAVRQIDYRIESLVNCWQNNRGFSLEPKTEEFIMRILGWSDYCILSGILSKGGNIRVCIKEHSGRHSYYIEKVK